MGSFHIERLENFVKVTLQGNLDPDTARKLEKAFTQIVSHPYLDVVVDLSTVEGMSQQWSRIVSALDRQVKMGHRKTYFASLGKASKAFFQEQGLLQSLRIAPTPRTALVDLGLVARDELERELAIPIIQVLLESLRKKITAPLQFKELPAAPKIESMGQLIGAEFIVTSFFFNYSVYLAIPSLHYLQWFYKLQNIPIPTNAKDTIQKLYEWQSSVAQAIKLQLNMKDFQIIKIHHRTVPVETLQKLTTQKATWYSTQSTYGGFCIGIQAMQEAEATAVPSAS